MVWILAFILASSANAWENHALPTSIAIAEMPELANASKVSAETLDDFLEAEQSKLAKVLEDEEQWARENVAKYPARPSVLAFVNTKDKTADIRIRFLQAIRVHPDLQFPLYLQELPGKKFKNATYFSPDAVTLMPKSLPPTGRYFAVIKPGQDVAPVDVFTTATDEPDYGLDIHLWEDSGTDFGRKYKFGLQPFGNPKLEFASQAPFHMGFYHESRVVNFAADYLLRTYPEYRIHLFFALSRFAFQTGHPYWGWRFAGMGAHYIQDLTQPYHSTVLPGENTVKLLLSGLIDMIGIHGPKKRLIEQGSDQHLAIENYVYCTLLNALQNNEDQTPMAKALKQNKNDKGLKYSPPYVRKILTAQSNALVDTLAKSLSQITPTKKGASSQCQAMRINKKTEALFSKLMENFGTHTRAWVRGIAPNSVTGNWQRPSSQK